MIEQLFLQSVSPFQEPVVAGRPRTEKDCMHACMYAHVSFATPNIQRPAFTISAIGAAQLEPCARTGTRPCDPVDDSRSTPWHTEAWNIVPYIYLSFSSMLCPSFQECYQDMCSPYLGKSGHGPSTHARAILRRSSGIRGSFQSALCLELRHSRTK